MKYLKFKNNLKWKTAKSLLNFLYWAYFSPKHCGTYKYRKKTKIVSIFEVNIVHYLGVTCLKRCDLFIK